jgi:hypothetical protein
MARPELQRFGRRDDDALRAQGQRRRIAELKKSGSRNHVMHGNGLDRFEPRTRVARNAANYASLHVDGQRVQEAVERVIAVGGGIEVAHDDDAKLRLAAFIAPGDGTRFFQTRTCNRKRWWRLEAMVGGRQGTQLGR